MLDPTDLEIIKESEQADAQLVTWDRVVRKEAGALTPYEVLDQALDADDTPEDAKTELSQLHKLSPGELTSLSEQGNKTAEYFRTNITFGPDVARLIRYLRVNRDYSWRSIARYCSELWQTDWGSNQIAGMAICEKAARMFEENYMEPPWN